MQGIGASFKHDGRAGIQAVLHSINFLRLHQRSTSGSKHRLLSKNETHRHSLLATSSTGGQESSRFHHAVPGRQLSDILTNHLSRPAVKKCVNLMKIFQPLEE